MRPVLSSFALGALFLLLGCTATVEPGRTGEEPLSKGVAQRVTATIQREASRLVRLETEHEAFLTTPEHPFATPRSGWVSAGRLVPGDWLVSERFGAVRVLSVRSEPAARPVPVFNLIVASSHAYFVGTDRVLVHNMDCQPGPQERGRSSAERWQEHYQADAEAIAKAIQEALDELGALESQPSTGAASKAEAARKAALSKRLATLRGLEEKTKQILIWMSELSELEARTPRTEQLKNEIAALRTKLSQERKRARDMKSGLGKNAADSEWPKKKKTPPETAEQAAEQAAEQTAEQARKLEFEQALEQARVRARARDQALRESEELMRQPPSPKRAAGLQSSYERLQEALRNERAALELALSEMASEYANLQRTEASSSRGYSWHTQVHLRSIEQRQLKLRTDWQNGLQQRLDDLRRHLQFMGVIAFRDGAAEDTVAREIALIERELQNPPERSRARPSAASGASRLRACA